MYVHPITFFFVLLFTFCTDSFTWAIERDSGCVTNIYVAEYFCNGAFYQQHFQLQQKEKSVVIILVAF